MNKVCTKCGIEKSLEEYYRDINHKDGRKSKCKSCYTVKQKEYNKSDKGKLTNAKAVAKYNKSDKGRSTNAKAVAKYQKSDKGKLTKTKANVKYQKSNKGKLAHAEYMKTDKGKASKVRSNHNRRTNEAKALKDFGTKESKIVMVLQDNKCAYCGETFNDGFKPTLDHINPVIEGGPLVIDNVQYLCQKHNSEKGVQKIDYRTDYHKYMVARYINENNYIS